MFYDLEFETLVGDLVSLLYSSIRPTCLPPYVKVALEIYVTAQYRLRPWIPLQFIMAPPPSPQSLRFLTRELTPTQATSPPGATPGALHPFTISSSHDGAVAFGVCTTFLLIMFFFVACRIWAKTRVIRHATWDDGKTSLGHQNSA